MESNQDTRIVLKNNSRVCIIGGGPAGSFFAIHLLRSAEKADREISVCIVDRQAIRGDSDIPGSLAGCNGCAGLISPALNKNMNATGIHLPPELIMEDYTHLWFHGLWKNFPLRIPKGHRIISVFRGSLPHGRAGSRDGFDAFLLKTAIAAGATVVSGTAGRIRETPAGTLSIDIDTPPAGTATLEADFTAIAAGIKNNPGLALETPLFRSFKDLVPCFEPPGTRQTLIVELKPGRDYLKKYMHREIYFIESGSGAFRLEHVALVPKQDFLTVALVGESIDRAHLPGETRSLVRSFLALPHVQAILPRISLDTAPVVCSCCPRMATHPSKSPFGDRIACIGDALGAKLYKGGLFSAFTTAESLAATIINTGIDRQSLSQCYTRLLAWLEADMDYGRRIFGFTRTTFNSPLLSRILYQAFATEMKFKTRDQWPLGNILWELGTGSGDYPAIYRDLTSWKVIRSIITGTVKTVRNMLAETFFGIAWEPYGRYPTVVLKERRGYIKTSISSPLGIHLEDSPEMERMYAIKIRASAQAVYRELGRYGDAGSRFLRLRFVSVSRLSGTPNQPGSVVRYKVAFPPLSMDVRLVRCIPDRSLVYEPGELFARQGILIFDITPTRDGNTRLVIYTAFNFRKGSTRISRLFWRLVKRLFPGWAHDVVWNHALCCIKGEAEQSEP